VTEQPLLSKIQPIRTAYRSPYRTAPVAFQCTGTHIIRRTPSIPKASPVVSGHERSFSDTLPQTSADGSAAILLVDDDEAVRALCRRGLEADGARVVEANNGEAALSLIQEWQGPLDLVITDLRMPVINGRELAEVLSVFRPELPVLCISADPGYPDRRLPTLVKPFAMRDLVDAARRMRTRATELRLWAEERRADARHARQLAAEMMTRHSALRQRVDLVAIGLELHRIGAGCSDGRGDV
jgi:CheY-like chemotaxis protein